ncbi:hypothetical protein [Neisseria sp. Ec49-e6-T10]|uniref:hypothetical protein n=1 Tax=Neisseria sp. Ec49-e6-T10 TaxID=3140744 RepID=UPI003EB82F55
MQEQEELDRITKNLPNAQKEVEEQINLNTPIDKYSKEQQKQLTEALSVEVAKKNNSHVIHIALSEDKKSLLAYTDKRSIVHIDIEKTLSVNNALKRDDLFNRELPEPTRLKKINDYIEMFHVNQKLKEFNSKERYLLTQAVGFAIDDNAGTPPKVHYFDIKNNQIHLLVGEPHKRIILNPQKILEQYYPKTLHTTIAKNGDSAIAIAKQLDQHNPKAALGHLLVTAQIKYIKGNNGHIIPNIRPGKEYSYDSTLYRDAQKEELSLISSKKISEETLINHKLQKQTQQEAEEKNYLSTLFKKQEEDKKTELDKEALFNKQVSIQNMLTMKVDIINSTPNKYTGNCNAKNPYKYDTPEYWIKEWAGNSKTWKDAHWLSVEEKKLERTPAKTQAEHYLFAKAIQNDDNEPIASKTYHIVGIAAAPLYFASKNIGLFSTASPPDFGQLEYGLKGWIDGFPTTKDNRTFIKNIIPGECIESNKK